MCEAYASKYIIEECVGKSFILLIRRPPRSTRTDSLFPYTTLFRSGRVLPSAPARSRHGPAQTPWSGPCSLYRHNPPGSSVCHPDWEDRGRRVGGLGGGELLSNEQRPLWQSCQPTYDDVGLRAHR